jgi:hypothetical protein
MKFPVHSTRTMVVERLSPSGSYMLVAGGWWLVFEDRGQVASKQKQVLDRNKEHPDLAVRVNAFDRISLGHSLSLFNPDKQD